MVPDHVYKFQMICLEEHKLLNKNLRNFGFILIKQGALNGMLSDVSVSLKKKKGPWVAQWDM
jgi:hypothetical protein